MFYAMTLCFYFNGLWESWLKARGLSLVSAKRPAAEEVIGGVVVKIAASVVTSSTGSEGAKSFNITKPRSPCLSFNGAYRQPSWNLRNFSCAGIIRVGLLKTSVNFSSDCVFWVTGAPFPLTVTLNSSSSFAVGWWSLTSCWDFLSIASSSFAAVGCSGSIIGDEHILGLLEFEGRSKQPSSCKMVFPAFDLLTFVMGIPWDFTRDDVESTWAGTLILDTVLTTGVATGGEERNIGGFASETNSNLGMQRSSFRPINAMVEKVRLRKWMRGYQNQNWLNTAIPTMAFIRSCPVRDRNMIPTLHPPALSIPCARIAPILVIVSSCLLLIVASTCFLNLHNRGSQASVVCNKTIDMPRRAPCRTKSTLSVMRGSSKEIALLEPELAHEIPIAMAAPYLTWGLYDSTSNDTIRGVCSGSEQRTNPSASTAVLWTSSLTSDTAKCSRRRIVVLLAVPRYAMAMAYIPPYRRTGSGSLVIWSITGSASSSQPYSINATPNASPRAIFSCCVLWAYVSISPALSLGVPTMTNPMLIPAASPAIALSLYKTAFNSSMISSSPVPIAASPNPKQAPCWMTSLPVFLKLSRRYCLMPSPWFAWINPNAYSAPPCGNEDPPPPTPPCCGK